MNLPVLQLHAESHGSSMMHMNYCVIQVRIQPRTSLETELECQYRNNGGVLSLYCGQGKANVVQFSLYEKSQSPGERFFINLSSVGPPEGEVALQKLIVERFSSN
jgi:hypothetical protein